jgi:hypothetical protein
MTNKLYTSVGITTNDNGNGPVTKVRYSNDMIRRIKQCNARGIPRWGNILRYDFVELPSPMSKVDALKHMLTLPEFSSPEDQVVISDALESRAPTPRVKVKQTPSLEQIKGRAKRNTTTAEDVLAAVADPA